MDALRSANSTVTCLRSPSRAVLEVENLLGQMAGCIAEGGLGSRQLARLFHEWSGALPTKGKSLQDCQSRH